MLTAFLYKSRSSFENGFAVEGMSQSNDASWDGRADKGFLGTDGVTTGAGFGIDVADEVVSNDDVDSFCCCGVAEESEERLMVAAFVVGAAELPMALKAAEMTSEPARRCDDAKLDKVAPGADLSKLDKVVLLSVEDLALLREEESDELVCSKEVELRSKGCLKSEVDDAEGLPLSRFDNDDVLPGLEPLSAVEGKELSGVESRDDGLLDGEELRLRELRLRG